MYVIYFVLVMVEIWDEVKKRLSNICLVTDKDIRKIFQKNNIFDRVFYNYNFKIIG